MKADSRSVGVAVLAAACLGVTACGSSSSTADTASGASGAPPTTQALGQTCDPTPLSKQPDVLTAQKALAKAAAASDAWSGPTTGPKAQKPGALVVFVPKDSNNVGDTGVGKGFDQAAKAMGWRTKTIGGGGSVSSTLAAVQQAIALHPAGIVVSSFDPAAARAVFAKAQQQGIVVVGNHTGFSPGRQAVAPGLFTNVTSDPAAIAQIAADCAIVASRGTAGVTIVGCGSQVQICRTKEDAMKKTIAACSGCKLLAQHDFPFEDAQQRYGGIASADVRRFGKKLSYMLSINDIYYDAAIPALRALHVGPQGPPLMIAAGDGSPAAFQRVRGGQFQIATVAEPLNLHGWQLADELNRGLANQKPSGYVTFPHITIKSNVDSQGGDHDTYEPANGYQRHYKQIWGVG